MGKKSKDKAKAAPPRLLRQWLVVEDTVRALEVDGEVRFERRERDMLGGERWEDCTPMHTDFFAKRVYCVSPSVWKAVEAMLRERA